MYLDMCLGLCLDMCDVEGTLTPTAFVASPVGGRLSQSAAWHTAYWPHWPYWPYWPIDLLAYGLWHVGLWRLAPGVWSLASGLWPLAHGPWPVGLWPVGLWPMAYGLLAYGLWPMASGLFK